MSNAFLETKNFFRIAVNYERPLTFDGWMKVDPSLKSAVLYVQFFEQIYTAWNKTKSYYTEEEDGVSTVMQYLEKNVPLIIANKSRFTPNYIYRVAFNCLYCICHDIRKDRERWENETSNIVGYDGEELDLFDTVVTAEDDFDTQLEKEELWSVIEELGPKASKVVNHIINGSSLGKVRKSSKTYEIDPLRDIEVSIEEMEEILKVLRKKLKRFADLM